MNTNARKDVKEGNGEVPCFPSWFLTMTESKPLLVVFAITVLLCSPFLMIFGAIYPLFKQ